MPTRLRLDDSTRFDRHDQQPESREIEVAAFDPVPETDQVVRATVGREPYLASEELENAVNLAIALGRPLLLQGDPGAGKTRLAHAVAFALGLPLEEAYIKSTSRAQDLLYSYDAVRRLYDSQLAPGGAAPDSREYVKLGPLGRAIDRAAKGRRSIVLIDEIDKADIDFPNDLLRELDQLDFEIPEVAGQGGQTQQFAVPADRPGLRPIIFITNNEEKTLPAAFLRRCVFHYVEFPADRAQLDAVLSLHSAGEPELRSAAIDVLLRLRELDLAKKPGLSELLDWVGYLQLTGTDPTELAKLPYAGALLKQRGDQARATDRLAGVKRLAGT
ncbi:MAG TPA: MoxR family ATPase [Streptosporangiaceae bacterium]|jgi:MoxR-like ATPase